MDFLGATEIEIELANSKQKQIVTLLDQVNSLSVENDFKLKELAEKNFEILKLNEKLAEQCSQRTLLSENIANGLVSQGQVVRVKYEVA